MIGRLVSLRARGHGNAPTEELADATLVRASASGDPAALAALFDRYGADVWRFLGRTRGGVAAADREDLVQATFLEIRRAAGRFRGQASVRTWILAVAANIARHYVRGDIRRRALAGARAAVAPARPDNPADLAERRELLRQLADALDRLPHDLRVAYVLCDLEEVSGVEAAAALGVRPGTLWRRLHEARQALRRSMSEEGPS